MKFHTLTALCTIASALIATAQVPSLINYQGRLTNASGAPVTGSKNFAISIYDAATGGTLLYTETIGAVTLDDNGGYSFQFGGSGTSNTLVTETVATTNGTATTFQKVLANSPVVANSVSVSDGTYTWSQSAGSSNEDQFGLAYSTSLRRVTANYYNGAPAAGRTITATYRYGTNGITGALSNGAEHWMAISVDGTSQGTRQRVLAVPFAAIAKHSQTSERAASIDESILAVDTATLARISLGAKENEQLNQYYLATSLVTGNASSSPLTINTNNTSLSYYDGYYGTKKTLTDGGMGVGNGGSTSKTFQLNNSYVEIASCNCQISLNGGDSRITYNYTDGTTAHSNRSYNGLLSYPNPHPTKKVTSITFSIYSANGAYFQGSSLSSISIVFHDSGTLSFNIPKINNIYTKTLLLVEGNRNIDDKITFSVFDSVGRSMLTNASEGSLASLNRYDNEGNLIVTITCNPSETQFATPGSLYNKLKILFLP